MRYRRSIYRKKRIKTIVVASVISVTVIALLLVVIGNLLGNKVEESVESRKTKDISSEEVPQHKTPRSVTAFPVPISEEGSSLSSRLSAARSAGYSDISFALDTPEGALLYSSPTAQSLGKQPSSDGLRTIENVISLTQQQQLYCVGVTHISDFLDDDELIRAASIGYHAALISEAIRSGMDEILILASSVPQERYYELIALADEVHRLSPEGVIGIALPITVFNDPQNATLSEELWSAFDYLSVDLSHCTGSENTSSEDQINAELGTMLYHLLRYNIRVVIPHYTDADVLNTLISAIKSNGSENILIMPQ